MSSKPRLAPLDAVRALGVLLVIAYHTSYRFAPATNDPFGGLLRVIGWMGVDLFFALSGFLVGGILAREKTRSNMGDYARKRFFRIVPIYLVALAVFAAGNALLNAGDQIKYLWKTLLFLTGYLQPIQGEAVVPYTITWSLSVEVSAYILLGLLAWKAWPRFRQVLIAVCLLSIPLRCFLAFGMGWDEGQIGIFPPARFDAIALGALAALGVFDRLLAIPKAAWIYGVATIAIIILFRYATWYPPFIATVGYSIFGLAAALWVASLARGEGEPGAAIKFAASIGLVSYFMYLFHLFFIEGLQFVAQRADVAIGFWPAFLLSSLLTYGAALLSWRYFERPIIERAAKRPAAVSLVP